MYSEWKLPFLRKITGPWEEYIQFILHLEGAFVPDFISNCILNISHVETERTCFFLIDGNMFLFILHVKIYLIVDLIKYVFFKIYFLKLQRKIFLLNLFF